MVLSLPFPVQQITEGPMPHDELQCVDLALLATYGRSGSSRLMELLRLTNACRVAGGFPYEVRSVQFGVLCALGMGEVQADGAILFGGFSYRPPAAPWDGEASEAFRQRILRDHEHLRPYEGIGDGRGPIAEKAVGLDLVSRLAETQSPAHIVLIDRDPRDVFLSVLAFNQRRGHVSFGAEDGPLVLARRIAGYYEAVAALRRRYRERTRVVSYRDIVAQPLRAVACATGRAEADVVADPQGAVFSHEVSSPEHVTAASVAESVGRWRAEADNWRAEFKVLAAAYAEFTAQFAASAPMSVSFAPTSTRA